MICRSPKSATLRDIPYSSPYVRALYFEKGSQTNKGYEILFEKRIFRATIA